MRFKNNKYFKN